MLADGPALPGRGTTVIIRRLIKSVTCDGKFNRKLQRGARHGRQGMTPGAEDWIIGGRVQGVGFRPFLYRLGRALSLVAGILRQDGSGPGGFAAPGAAWTC